MPISNVDLLNRVRSIEAARREDHNILKDHDNRLRKVENFQIAYEAAAKALKDSNITRGTTINKDFVNVVLKFVALLTLLITVFYGIIQALQAANK